MTLELEPLVELWRATLDPAAARAARTRAARRTGEAWPDDPEARHARWMARAKEAAGREHELVREFDFAKVPARLVLERLAAMESWQPHPSVALWLVDTFAHPNRAPVMDGQKCFRRVFKLLVTQLDHDGATRLRGWLGTHRTRVAATEYGAKFFDEGMQRVLEKTAARLAAARPLTDDERAALAASDLVVDDAPVSEPTRDALLAAVYENPLDDAPRMVLADFLQQRDDPRGEFIALELVATPTREQKRRRAELLKAHGKAWFPEALHRVVKRDAAYERGFLARGTVMSAQRLPVELSTFRALDADGHAVDLDQAVFRAIEAWTGLPVTDPPRQHRPQLHVTRLGIRAGFRIPVDEIVAAFPAETWPSITELTIEVGNLEHCLVDGMPGWFDELAAQLGSRHAHVQRLTFDDIAEYRRDGGALRLATLALPPKIAYALTWRADDLRHIHAARARWFAWLDRQAVPISVTNRVDELRAVLPPSAAQRLTT